MEKLENSILENNKLIAEFMGLDPNHLDALFVYLVANGMKSLSYNSSWDALMPVVEKISSMGYYFDINNHGTHWTGDKDTSKYICAFYKNHKQKYRYPEITREFGSTLHSATYKAVVKFIKWYNKNNNR